MVLSRFGLYQISPAPNAANCTHRLLHSREPWDNLISKFTTESLARDVWYQAPRSKPMSTANQPPPTPFRQAGDSSWGGTLLLTQILTQAVGTGLTIAIVLGALYLRPPESIGDVHRHQADGAGAAPAAGAVKAGAPDAPLEQGGTISPQGKHTDAVFYPVPYALPPNLKLSSAKRRYDITRQDEKGFTWSAVPNLDEFTDEGKKFVDGMFGRDIGFLRGANGLKPNLQFEDFRWEAKGVRVGRDTVFPQEGAFNTVAGKEGPVNFPIPYEVAPNVELSGPGSLTSVVIVTEIRPTGFKWQNSGKDASFHNGSVTWKAKGIRAAEIVPAKVP
jgi:hypothetical protein